MQGKRKNQGEKGTMQKAEPPENENVENDEEMPPQIGQILQMVPEERRAEAYSSIFQLFAMERSPEADVAKKITSEHIDKLLDHQNKSMEYSYKDSQQTKFIYFVVFLVTAILVVFIIVFMKDNPEMLEKILTIIGSAGLGAFGGYGVGKISKE